jgi:hypothetical protein
MAPPVLSAKDGTIYFGGPISGIYVYRGSTLSHADWHEGLGINGVNWIREHPDGTVWFASYQMGIAVYDPRGIPGTGPASPLQTSWEEYPLVSTAIVRDFKGNLWCALKDQPSKVSRWNGQVWEHFELGPETRLIRTLLVDNLQRLHVVMAADPGAVTCRLTNGRIDYFPDFTDMLVDSVRTGSREFKSGGAHRRLGPLVTGDQEIWTTDAYVYRLVQYSGGTWHEIKANRSRTSLFKHKDNQVLIATGGRFETLDRGQIVQFADEHTRNQEYLLGESGLQPFDEDVYAAKRGRSFRHAGQRRRHTSSSALTISVLSSKTTSRLARPSCLWMCLKSGWPKEASGLTPII